jgi:hypothetical protein
MNGMCAVKYFQRLSLRDQKYIENKRLIQACPEAECGVESKINQTIYRALIHRTVSSSGLRGGIETRISTGDFLTHNTSRKSSA